MSDSGEGRTRGIEGLAQAIDRLTYVVALAVRERVVIDSAKSDDLKSIMNIASSFLIDDFSPRASE